MLKVLLTSNKAWYSDRCKLIWKKKVSKSNVLLYQLQASVLGIKEKEFGLSDVMYPTPTQDSASERTKKYKQGGTPLPIAVKMFPTPSASCQMDVVAPPETVQQNSKGWSVTRVGTGTKFGAKLNDVVNKIEKMYPTPEAGMYKVDVSDKNYHLKRLKKKKQLGLPGVIHLQKTGLGGKLNPNFVEFLMGYPMNWTKIEPTESKVLETPLSHKSPENLEKQLSKQKMYRTPTSMDINEDSMIYAAKILKGKVNRNSNQRVQITLSTDVAMEYLKNNPHLINEFDKPFMERPNLPNKLDFINYLKSQTTIKELVQKTNLPKTKIEHWFRKDNCFSYPSIEDWNIIKPFLKELKFDKELTYQIEKDWKE
jgi:DNA (cytosine-5)-methyltransferase 1